MTLRDRRHPIFLYIKEAVHAKQTVDRIFIIRPIIPVSLSVTISINETTVEIRNALSGPKIKPPIVIIISFGSYFRNKVTGILPTAIRVQARAESIAKVVSLLVLEIFIFTS